MDRLVDDATSLMERLERQVAALAAAGAPSEVFRLLLEGSRLGAPRTAIFLLRDGRWKGWGSVGYGAKVASLLKSWSQPADEGWLGRLVADVSAASGFREPGEAGPEFGQPDAAEALGLPIRVGERTMALLVAERGAGERPWTPAALGVLIHVARLRLELDLARRRLRVASGEPARQEAPPGAETAVASPAPAAPVEPGPTSLAPWSQEPAPSPEARRQDEAGRFARLVATDIRLYNEEAVMMGRRHGDLAKRLGDQLERGRDAFRRRFPDLVADGQGILQDAFVQVLAGGDPSLLPAPGTDPGREVEP